MSLPLSISEIRIKKGQLDSRWSLLTLTASASGLAPGQAKNDGARRTDCFRSHEDTKQEQTVEKHWYFKMINK